MLYSKLLLILLLSSIRHVQSLVDIHVLRSELVDRPTSLVTVNTSLGSLVGYEQTVFNKTINVFYGIPYAKSPVGKLRFKKTELVKKFPQNPFLALNFKNHCLVKLPEKRFYHINDSFSEDCLFMNIWAPKIHRQQNGICSKKFKVMVFILGATNSIFRVSPFLDKDNKQHLIYSGELYASKDTILVTFNYRQRLLSWLHVDEELPGNLAFFDQNLALQWTYEHIDQLCGDRSDITLFGQSFGGLATAIHTLSPHSKHLFKKAIIQSSNGLFSDIISVTKNEIMIGSILAVSELGCLNVNTEKMTKNIELLDMKIRLKYFINSNGAYKLNRKRFNSDLRKNLYKFESKLNDEIKYLHVDDYIDKNLLILVEFVSKYAVGIDCLQNISVEKVNTHYLNEEKRWQFFFDNDFVDKKTSLDYKLFNKLNIDPKLKLLIGVVKDEQIRDAKRVGNKYYSDQFNAPLIPKEDAKALIKSLNFLKTDKKGFETYLAEYYVNESRWELSNGYFDAFINAESDNLIFCPNIFLSKYASLVANVSNYVITYKPTKHFTSSLIEYDLNDISYAYMAHGDELTYLFGLPFRVQNQFNDLDREFSSTLVDLWTTFAKEGKMPTLSNGNEWPVSNKFSSNGLKFVEINNKFLRERKFEFEERCNLWEELLPYYKR